MGQSRRRQLGRQPWLAQLFVPRAVFAEPRNPEQAFEQSTDEDNVREAVLRLREEQRQVIMLRFVEELDYREVAAMIGKSVPAVRVIQHRALGNLRKLMQQ